MLPPALTSRSSVPESTHQCSRNVSPMFLLRSPNRPQTRMASGFAGFLKGFKVYKGLLSKLLKGKGSLEKPQKTRSFALFKLNSACRDLVWISISVHRKVRAAAEAVLPASRILQKKVSFSGTLADFSMATWVTAGCNTKVSATGTFGLNRSFHRLAGQLQAKGERYRNASRRSCSAHLSSVYRRKMFRKLI